MNSKIRFVSAWMLTASLGLAIGCGDDKDDGDSAGGSATDSGATASATDSDSGQTTGVSDSTTADSESDSATGGSATTDDTATTVTTTGSTDPLPDGSMCDDDSQCESEKCFIVGVLGGICGECNTDEDCEEWGCSLPNPLSDPPEGAVCGDGMLGSGCMGDEACMDPLMCATVLDVPGVITASTCSECVEDADCTDQLCNPTYDVLNLSGNKTCVDPGSVPDGEGCDVEGSGTEACENFCAGADVMGLLTLGVCSPCITDEGGVVMGCAKGEECVAPEVSLSEGLIAGMCMTPA